jgi:hypothetical protein
LGVNRIQDIEVAEGKKDVELVSGRVFLHCGEDFLDFFWRRRENEKIFFVLSEFIIFTL